MKNTIRNVLESILLKKYPEIISLDEITDLSEEYGLEYLEHHYHVSFTTSECFDVEKMMEIDKEVKTLFNMLGLQNSNPFSHRKPSIASYFDCGDGEGYRFIAAYGYKH